MLWQVLLTAKEGLEKKDNFARNKRRNKIYLFKIQISRDIDNLIKYLNNNNKKTSK